MLLFSFVLISVLATPNCSDIVFKINNGKPEKYFIFGSYKVNVTSNAIEYNCNSKIVVVVVVVVNRKVVAVTVIY